MTGTRGGAAGRDAGESRQDPLPKLARVRATGLAAAAVGLLTVGALGSSSDIAATVEISVAALILIVALDQRPGLDGPRLLVGKLTPRSLARLVTGAMVTFGLVLAVDWALGERLDGLSVGLVALSFVVAALALASDRRLAEPRNHGGPSTRSGRRGRRRS